MGRAAQLHADSEQVNLISSSKDTSFVRRGSPDPVDPRTAGLPPRNRGKQHVNQTPKSAVPLWYWIIAAVALLWNLLGCLFFAVEVFALEAAMQSWTEPQKEWARSLPAWIYAVYGLAVTTGVAGSIGLLLRKSWTVPLFRICLAAVIVQMGYTMLISGGLQVMGPSEAAMPLLVIAIAAALLGFSWFAQSRGWFGPVSSN